MGDELGEKNDAYLDRMKDGLSSSAVVKAQFASMRSACSRSLMFAYEGVTDKEIYYHWIEKLAPHLKYEPFVCKNKDHLLKLFDTLRKDLTGLGDGVYFFVDRDFDELRGRTLVSSIFMTDMYSVENYLVNAKILDDLLKIEFRCNGAPKVREKVVAIFEQLYEDFLAKTATINYRIFSARKCGIRQINELPKNVSVLVDVEIDRIISKEVNISELVILERELTEDEISMCDTEFKLFERRSRYRGKFAISFFLKWLDCLRKDRNSENSIHFTELPQPDLAPKGSAGIDALAAKAAPPLLLKDFLELAKGSVV